MSENDTDQPTARCPFSNPRELFADLADARRTEGLTFSETLNSYVVSRYDEIVEAVGRPEVYSSTATIPDPPPFILDIFKDRVPSRGTLLGIDNPDHDRLRASVSSFFVPRRLRRFEPMIRREAHAIIDTFVSRGEANLKSVFALPLPLKMITSIVGLDPERYLWIGQSLALFGGHPDLAHGTMEDKLQGILELHDYVREVIEERRTSRRDDLISHVWEMRDTGQVEMTDFEMLSMFPGLILAGHETTTNLLSTGLSHLLHTGQYEAAQQNDETRARAIEELLRYESAITGMRRKVLTPTQLGGTDLKPGDEVFLAYASGSRDETHFDNSGELDINRPIKDGHLGFGRGIHACLGAPLARLLLGIEFAVIAERLPGLQLAVPYEDIEYLPVGEGRGVVGLPVAWDVRLASVVHAGGDVTVPGTAATPDVHVIVEKVVPVADGIIEFSLRSPSEQTLLGWTPGAHIDVGVGENVYRQYSLCGDPHDTGRWQIAVLRENESRGGSLHLHDVVKAGDTLAVRGPRNHFVFEPARRMIFIAGGIGITPIRPMVRAAEAAGCDWTLIYLGHTRSTMAYQDELAAYGDRVVIWPGDERQRYDLSFLGREDPENLLIYCCGPERLINGVEEACGLHPIDTLRVERFAPMPLGDNAYENTEIEVVLDRSGKTLTVPPDRTVLEVVNEAGAGVVSTCQEGTCGTCEVRVLEGTPEHRDSVLTARERQDNDFMMVCVSRCTGRRLVLDL